MSFILDAVKKSEQERRYAQSEPLQSWYYHPVKQKQKSFPWISALLVLNTLVLAGLFLWVVKPAWFEMLIDPQSKSGESANEGRFEEKLTGSDADMVSEIQMASADSEVSLQEQVPQDQGSHHENAGAVSEDIIVTPNDAQFQQQGNSSSSLNESIQDEIITPSVAGTSRTAHRPQGPIPDIESVPESVLIHIPAIAFSSHLFSSSPSARQIVVNGQKLREGDYLNRDLQLLEIEEKSVIFQQFQYPFRVVLSRYWVRDEQ